MIFCRWPPWLRPGEPSIGWPRNRTSTPMRTWYRRPNRMFAFGSIVLARFPFTDLSGDKRRPALVVSRDNDRRTDLVVCFITSVPRTGPDMAPIIASADTGLKVPSVVRFDTIATLD